MKKSDITNLVYDEISIKDLLIISGVILGGYGIYRIIKLCKKGINSTL